MDYLDRIQSIVDTSRLRRRIGPTAGAVIAICIQAQYYYFYLGNGVTEFTAIEFGSVTKLFTAMLVAAAIVSHRLELESTLCSLLDLPSRQGDSIRISDLLTHTSGLPRLSLPWFKHFSNDPYAHYSELQLLSYIGKRGCVRPANQTYLYSNLGYAVLGATITHCYVWGYERLVQDQLCRSWGVPEITFSYPDGLLAPGFSRSGALATPWHWKAYAPCGALRGTASELMRVLGLITDRVGLSKDFYDLCDRPIDRRAIGTQIGFGWMFDARSNFRWHNGATGGHSTFVAISGRPKSYLSILCNQQLPAEVTDLGTALAGELNVTEPAQEGICEWI